MARQEKEREYGLGEYQAKNVAIHHTPHRTRDATFLPVLPFHRYLLQFDSVHGAWAGHTCTAVEGATPGGVVAWDGPNAGSAVFSKEDQCGNVDWAAAGVEVRRV
jgi:hypothetical protein